MYIPSSASSSGAGLPRSQRKHYHQLMNELLSGAMLGKPQPAEPNIPPSTAPPTAPLSAHHMKDTNFDVCSASKYYESKMPPTLAPPLLIDADNYMLRDVRPRSLSHGALQRPPRTPSQSSPLDLDMFCVRETVNSLAAAVQKLNLPSREASPVSTSSENVSKSNCSSSNSEETYMETGSVSAAPSCARTLSLHGMLCTCRLTCCCLCVSLCSPDCHACLHNVCARFSAGLPCQRNSDVLPPITLIRNKVSFIILYYAKFYALSSSLQVPVSFLKSNTQHSLFSNFHSVPLICEREVVLISRTNIRIDFQFFVTVPAPANIKSMNSNLRFGSVPPSVGAALFS